MAAARLLPLALVAAACTAETSGSSDPTWADVAPRLARSCVPCHDGTSDTPALTTLDDARRHGTAMAFAVSAGLMPPGGVDRGGSCQTFRGPAPFTDDDAAVLSAWVDAGMPGQEALSPHPQPPLPVGEGASPADRIVQVSLPLSPLAAERHRCFLVDPGPTSGGLAGVRVDGAGVVHHAMFFSLPDAGAAAALDAADAEPGWACPGVPAGVGALLATWVPGAAEMRFPEGAAATLSGASIVVQVHQYGAAPVADARLELLIDDDPARPVRTVPIAATDFALPPGEASVAITRTLPLPLADGTRVLGVMPHLHAAGRAASLAVDGGPCLVDAPRYGFGWQEIAFYDEPVALDAGRRATLSCTWDTRGREGITGWGESSEDEMCTVFLLVTEP